MRALTNSLTKLTLFAFILLGVLSVNYLRAFNGPPGSAPACPTGSVGCDAPINLGSATQEKTGGIISNGLWSKGNVQADGLYYFFGLNQSLGGDGGSSGRLIWDSGNADISQMIFRGSGANNYGKVYGDQAGARFGLVDGDNNWSYRATKDVDTQFLINNAVQMTILANGRVGIGVAAPAYKLDVNGTAAANAFVYSSDVRLKENIEDAPGLDAVERLRGVKYDWKDSGETSYGLIAQEVEEVLPELVSTDEHGMKSVAYGNLVSVLIEAVKEQQEQIETLQNEIESLKQ